MWLGSFLRPLRPQGRQGWPPGGTSEHPCGKSQERPASSAPPLHEYGASPQESWPACPHFVHTHLTRNEQECCAELLQSKHHTSRHTGAAKCKLSPIMIQAPRPPPLLVAVQLQSGIRQAASGPLATVTGAPRCRLLPPHHMYRLTASAGRARSRRRPGRGGGQGSCWVLPAAHTGPPRPGPGWPPPQLPPPGWQLCPSWQPGRGWRRWAPPLPPLPLPAGGAPQAAPLAPAQRPRCRRRRRPQHPQPPARSRGWRAGGWRWKWGCLARLGRGCAALGASLRGAGGGGWRRAAGSCCGEGGWGRCR